MPHARIAWRTRRLADVARRLAGRRGDAAVAACRRILGASSGAGDPALGRSALNNDGTPLELCVTARRGGTTLRVLGDPAAHLPVEERLEASWAAVEAAMSEGGAADLIPLAWRTVERVVPAAPERRAAYRDGFFWIALSPDRPGAAFYVEAAPLGREGGWSTAGRWLEELLPTMEAAAPVLAALAARCTVASLGLEGTGPERARAKIYFRLDAPASLAELGVELLGSPEMVRFLRLAMGEHGVDLDGLVMSAGFSLGNGRLVDVKVDLCGHCLAYAAGEWPDVARRCGAEHGLTPLPVDEALAAGDCEVAFFGLGLDAAGGARLNLYLKPGGGGVPPGRAELVAAVDDAVGCLEDLQRGDGRWVDYELPVGASDQWVTAYVGAALARLGRALDHGRALAAAGAAADWLMGQRTYRAGWGYNGLTGPDADSTAMALSLLAELGREVRDQDRRFLLHLWRVDGVATFPGPGAWGRCHWDVTPWAYLALTRSDRSRLRRDFLRGLRENRGPDGLWRAYWWRTPLYSTFLTLEALGELGLDEPDGTPPRFEGEVDNAFDLACAVGIGRLRGATPAELGPALRRLLDWQQRDGRWPGHPNLRVTDDACYEPWVEPVGEYYRDHEGTITTATALRALAHLLRAETGRGRSVA